MALEHIIPTPVKGYECVGSKNIKIFLDDGLNIHTSPVIRVAVHANIDPEPGVPLTFKVEMAHLIITQYSMTQDSYPLFSVSQSSSINVISSKEVNVSSSIHTSISDFDPDHRNNLSANNLEDVLEAVSEIIANLAGE
jgi:hypothetical protein